MEARWVLCSHMVSTFWPHVVLRGVLPNTCGVTMWARWGSILGQLRAEFGHGPKGKVEAHTTLYKIYLGFMTVSALD
jgi:hypothetical protein